MPPFHSPAPLFSSSQENWSAFLFRGRPNENHGASVASRGEHPGSCERSCRDPPRSSFPSRLRSYHRTPRLQEHLHAIAARQLLCPGTETCPHMEGPCLTLRRQRVRSRLYGWCHSYDAPGPGSCRRNHAPVGSASTQHSSSIRGRQRRFELMAEDPMSVSLVQNSRPPKTTTTVR